MNMTRRHTEGSKADLEIKVALLPLLRCSVYLSIVTEIVSFGQQRRIVKHGRQVGVKKDWSKVRKVIY